MVRVTAAKMAMLRRRPQIPFLVVKFPCDQGVKECTYLSNWLRDVSRFVNHDWK